MISFKHLLSPALRRTSSTRTFMLAFKTNEVIQYFQTGAYKIAVDVAGVDGYIFFISWVWLMVIEPR
jgi:hypothetical protein